MRFPFSFYFYCLGFQVLRFFLPSRTRTRVARLQAIIQSENIIVNLKLAWSITNQMEKLAKMNRISTTDLDNSRNKYDNRIWRMGWLDIDGFDRVLILTDRFDFFNDGLATLYLIALHRQHGLSRLLEEEKTGKER